MAQIQPLLLYMCPPENDRSTPTLGALTWAFCWTHEVLHRTAVHPSGLCVLLTQAPRSCCLSPASKLLGALGSHLCPPSLRSWFCGSTK
jgi:hypothetical protein